MDNKEPIIFDICVTCGNILDDGEEFCSYCGTKRGEGEFEPENNIMECIYGPPPCDYFFKCKSCGHYWTENLVYSESVEACPKCGSHDICPSEDTETVFNFDTIDF